MRAIIQRVLSASVTVNQQRISSINRGILVLIGLNRTDTMADLAYIANKILNLKLFDSINDSNNNSKPWQRSVMHCQYPILCVSQFTLYAILKGNKLDFHSAMNPAESAPLYNQFLLLMKSLYKPELIHNGEFGAMMQVELINDGPVTIELSSDSQDFTKENLKLAKTAAIRDRTEQNKLKKLNSNNNNNNIAAATATAAEVSELSNNTATIELNSNPSPAADSESESEPVRSFGC